MSTFPILPIFPSLSRAPGMDSSAQVEDDTVRDSMELGYIASRPRFTRARRTWNCNIRHLIAEDIRALTFFRDITAQRGANSFYYPNLLKNGSFEVGAEPGSDEIVAGWYMQGGNNLSNFGTVGRYGEYGTVLPAGTDGSAVVGLYSNGTSPEKGYLQSSLQIPCNVGDTFNFVVWVFVSVGPLGSLASVNQLTVTYDDGTVAYVNGNYTMPAPGTGWVLCGCTYVVPAPAAPSTSVKGLAQVSFGVQSSVQTATLFDRAGLCLVAAAWPQMEMIGSNPILRPVRFPSGGLPQFSDLGWIGGQKRYGVTFKLEEV